MRLNHKSDIWHCLVVLGVALIINQLPASDVMLPLLFSDTWILNFPTSDFLHTHDNDVDNNDNDDNGENEDDNNDNDDNGEDEDDNDGDDDDNDSPSQTSASVTRVRGCMAQSVNARRAPCKSKTALLHLSTLHGTLSCVLCVHSNVCCVVHTCVCIHHIIHTTDHTKRNTDHSLRTTRHIGVTVRAFHCATWRHTFAEQSRAEQSKGRHWF